MTRSHGLSGEFGPSAWTAPARTPPLHPDAVTLGPGADPADLVARIDTRAPGATVKDSFADLDLGGAGFRVLFEARWIHRAAGPPAVASGLTQDMAADADTLGPRGWPSPDRAVDLHPG